MAPKTTCGREVAASFCSSYAARKVLLSREAGLLITRGLYAEGGGVMTMQMRMSQQLPLKLLKQNFSTFITRSDSMDSMESIIRVPRDVD
jgi:hypothetical protein